MKKKILLGLLILLAMFAVTGCGKKKEEKKKEEPEVKLADDEFILSEKKYKLDTEEEGYNLKYKIDKNFSKWDSGNALNYFPPKNEDGTKDFAIRIFYYKNKTLDYAINDTVDKIESQEEVEVNGVKYTKIHFINYNDANTYLFYHIFNEKDVYVFVFTAWEENERMENIFLSNVVFPE